MVGVFDAQHGIKPIIGREFNGYATVLQILIKQVGGRIEIVLHPTVGTLTGTGHANGQHVINGNVHRAIKPHFFVTADG